MAAAPAAAAVWADVLWCLGLGCLVWAVRDGAELLVGRGPVRCFVLDLLAFTAAGKNEHNANTPSALRQNAQPAGTWRRGWLPGHWPGRKPSCRRCMS